MINWNWLTRTCFVRFKFSVIFPQYISLLGLNYWWLKIYKSSLFCCLIDILHTSINFFSKGTINLGTNCTAKQFSRDLFFRFYHLFGNSKGGMIDLLVTLTFLLRRPKGMIIYITWVILKPRRYLLLFFGMFVCVTIY